MINHKTVFRTRLMTCSLPANEAKQHVRCERIGKSLIIGAVSIHNAGMRWCVVMQTAPMRRSILVWAVMTILSGMLMIVSYAWAGQSKQEGKRGAQTCKTRTVNEQGEPVTDKSGCCVRQADGTYTSKDGHTCTCEQQADGTMLCQHDAAEATTDEPSAPAPPTSSDDGLTQDPPPSESPPATDEPPASEQPPAPTDVCSNIKGAQASVPDGYERGGSRCNKIPDECPKLPGTQEQVPRDAKKINGACRKIDELRFITSELPRLAPDVREAQEQLGAVDVDETAGKTLASENQSEADNKLFPWLSTWQLALLILIPAGFIGLCWWLMRRG